MVVRAEDGDEPNTIVALNAQGDDVSYSTRHVEESWHHLMKSEDTAKFKQIAVCNFDFLLAAVSALGFAIIIIFYFFYFVCAMWECEGAYGGRILGEFWLKLCGYFFVSEDWFELCWIYEVVNRFLLI